MINELIYNNAFMVQQDYELTWMQYYRMVIHNHTSNMDKEADKATSADELYDIFSNKGMSYTTSLSFRKIFRPNDHMKACLQYLADKGASAPKYIIALYRGEIKNFNKGRLYEAINTLDEVGLIKGKLLSYVSPKPVTIWITPFASTEQITRAINKYQADKIRHELKKEQQIKKIEYIHTKAPKEQEVKKQTWAEVLNKNE